MKFEINWTFVLFYRERKWVSKLRDLSDQKPGFLIIWQSDTVFVNVYRNCNHLTNELFYKRKYEVFHFLALPYPHRHCGSLSHGVWSGYTKESVCEAKKWSLYPKPWGLNSVQCSSAITLWYRSWNLGSCGIRGHALKISTGGGLRSTDFSKGMPELWPKTVFETKWVYLGCLLTDFGTQTGEEAHLFDLLSWEFDVFCWLFCFPTPGHTPRFEFLLLPGFSTPPARS